MTATDLIFQVGNIQFTDPFEMPNGSEDGLGDLGGFQNMTVTEFPGGIISAQLYGRYPKKIEWKGKIFGASAHDRARQLDALTTQGRINLSYGQWNIDGVLKDFVIKAKYQFEVHYEACFIPVQDNTQVSQNSSTAPPNPQGTLAQAQQVAQYQAQTPTTPYTFSPAIQQGLTQVNNNINQTLQNYSGNLASFQPSDITSLQNQISSLQSQLAPLINGSDLNAASAASDLNTSLNTMSVALGASTGIIAQIPVINPNLYALASIYYKDPGQWEVIGKANSITDPFPIGSFDLIIPNIQGVVQTQPPTIV